MDIRRYENAQEIGYTTHPAREFNHKLAHLYGSTSCAFCKLAMTRELRKDTSSTVLEARCRRCGFRYEDGSHSGIQDYEQWTRVSTLRQLATNDSELGIEELCTHLGRRYSDVFSLSPQRFEDVVEDIFRHNWGYRTLRTPKTRDGGHDIVLLGKDPDDHVIVEVKRYAKHRAVGVGVVRQLLGVQLVQGISKAKLVTTSRFSIPAQTEAQASSIAVAGFSLELVDAGALLSQLKCYNAALPPLESLEIGPGGLPLPRNAGQSNSSSTSEM